MELRTAATMPRDDVAIVHDYLNQFGGAERCVLEMARIWPGVRIYTSLYRPESTFPAFQGYDIRTSFMDALPVDRHFRALAPLYPAAFAAFRPLRERVVITSSSGWAHGVRTSPESLHVVYCHTPARWLHVADRSGDGIKGRLSALALRPLYRWDVGRARHVDGYIANSALVRDRIRRVYQRDAAVVHPPVEVSRFRPRPRGERLLVVCRLLDYKRVDLIIGAANRTGIGLDIVGVGPAMDSLREIAGPSVIFHGRLDDGEVTELMEDCRAVCVPGLEDFGMSPVEGNAAGKPVIAFGAGGALETVTDGVTGALFVETTVDAVVEAIRRADAIPTSPERLAQAAARFSPEVFRVRLAAAIEAIAERRSISSRAPRPSVTSPV
jgi:glycosyltransferase involved in cell wall biosynthesis